MHECTAAREVIIIIITVSCAEHIQRYVPCYYYYVCAEIQTFPVNRIMIIYAGSNVLLNFINNINALCGVKIQRLL